MVLFLVLTLAFNSLSLISSIFAGSVHVADIRTGKKANTFENRIFVYFYLCVSAHHIIEEIIVITASSLYYGRVSELEYDYHMQHWLNLSWFFIVLTSNCGLSITFLFWKLAAAESSFKRLIKILEAPHTLPWFMTVVNLFQVSYLAVVAIVFRDSHMRQRLWIDLVPYPSWGLISIFSVFALFDIAACLIRLRKSNSSLLYQTLSSYWFTIFLVSVTVIGIFIMQLLNTSSIPIDYFLNEEVARASPTYNKIMPIEPDFSLLFGGLTGTLASIPIIFKTFQSWKMKTSEESKASFSYLKLKYF